MHHLPEIAAGYHLFRDILAGVRQVCIHCEIGIAARETRKRAAFEVNEHFPAAGHIELAYPAAFDLTAGVAAGTGNEADIAVVAALGERLTGEQRSRSVVQNDDPAGVLAASFKLCAQSRSEIRADSTFDIHLLCQT